MIRTLICIVMIIPFSINSTFAGSHNNTDIDKTSEPAATSMPPDERIELAQAGMQEMLPPDAISSATWRMHMRGPRMMHRGMGFQNYWIGYGYGMVWPGYGPQYLLPKLLNEKEAKKILENSLKATRNPNLKLGKIADKGLVFEAEILTKDSVLVDKIIVDKSTRWMSSVYK